MLDKRFNSTCAPSCLLDKPFNSCPPPCVQDERCAKLAVYPFLEKVYLERILQGGEVGSSCVHFPANKAAARCGCVTVRGAACGRPALRCLSAAMTQCCLVCLWAASPVQPWS